MARRHANRKERSYLAPPEGAWIAFGCEMLESLAWRSLSRAGRTMIDRLCIEHMTRGGRENGRLAIGYDDFVRSGIHRSQVPSSIAEVTALGFVRVTEAGQRATKTTPGRRARYRLTFVGTIGGDDSGPATHEWRSVTDENIGHVRDEVEATKARTRGGRPSKSMAPRPEHLQ